MTFADDDCSALLSLVVQKSILVAAAKAFAVALEVVKAVLQQKQIQEKRENKKYVMG
jgi:hypothetical protein